jgi:hypothetical protein
MAIGTGWSEGSFVDAAWVAAAWSDAAGPVAPTVSGLEYSAMNVVLEYKAQDSLLEYSAVTDE